LKEAVPLENKSKSKFDTNSGITVDEVYTPSHLRQIQFDYEKDLGLPGGYPFTRGITSSMYRDDPWLVAQYSGFGSVEETNQRYKDLLKKGITALNVALDLPTQIGYDSDNPVAEGEVGKVGVAIDSLKDLEDLFNGIHLSMVKNISCIVNAVSPVMLAMFIVLGEKQGLSPKEYSIYLQNDILKEFSARGTYIFPPGPSLKLSVDVMEYSTKYLPRNNAITICGYHFREAGCNAIQELAFTLANAIAYLDAALKRGLQIDLLSRKINIFLSCGIEIFEEVAKFRALRKLWAKILKERFHANDSESLKITIRAYTSGSNLTRQQPSNNIVRATLEALGAILGGVQHLNVSSMDEAYAIPTKEAQTLAIRTQQILYHESGIAKTADPLGGSYYLEFLTKELENRTWNYLDRIITLGGAVNVLESGFIQREISESSYERQKKIEKGDQVIIGVNQFCDSTELEPKNISKSDPESERRQVSRLKRLRQERDDNKVKHTLEKVRQSAMSGENIIHSIIEAVREYATVGEICDQLRQVYGEARVEGFF
jgi:methylmalonyl-CoA mutase N-terminal domain/subunit